MSETRSQSLEPIKIAEVHLALRDKDVYRDALAAPEFKQCSVKYYGLRSGAVDFLGSLEFYLAPASQIAMTLVAIPYLHKLLLGDSLDALARRHREFLVERLEALGVAGKESIESIASLCSELIEAARGVHETITTPEKFIPRSSTVIFGVGEHMVTAATDQPSSRNCAVEAIEAGIAASLLYLLEYGAPPNTTVIQLFFDPQSETWRFLLCPTSAGMGNYCDQLVDLQTCQVHRFESGARFTAFINLDQRDAAYLPVAIRHA